MNGSAGMNSSKVGDPLQLVADGDADADCSVVKGRDAHDGLKTSADFHDTRTGLKRGDDARQLHLESFKQDFRSTVPNSHPNQFDDASGSGCEKVEIFVLADHDHFTGRRLLTNDRINHPHQTQFPDVLRGVALAL